MEELLPLYPHWNESDRSWSREDHLTYRQTVLMTSSARVTDFLCLHQDSSPGYLRIVVWYSTEVAVVLLPQSPNSQDCTHELPRPADFSLLSGTRARRMLPEKKGPRLEATEGLTEQEARCLR